MPTFHDPKQDADELGEAARGLAHATRNIERPAGTYDMLGSLHYELTSVQQSLGQLASWHHRHADHAATDDGNREAGREHAEKAGGWSRRCATARPNSPLSGHRPAMGRSLGGASPADRAASW